METLFVVLGYLIAGILGVAYSLIMPLWFAIPLAFLTGVGIGMFMYIMGWFG